MQQPPQITFKGLNQTETLMQLLYEKIEKMEQFFETVISCHVVIEQTQKHQRRGRLNNVRINLGVVGRELVVTHNERENLSIAIRDAFNDLRRQLEDHAQKKHGSVKSHPTLIHGRIVRLLDNFGFIEGTDDQEYYFNRDYLMHPESFDQLSVGAGVRFIAVVGNEGWQAHRVKSVSHVI